MMRKIISNILHRIIDFFIDLDDLVNPETPITLFDLMEEEGLVECPWCEGNGFLTKDGEVVG